MSGSSSAEVDLGSITFYRFNTINAILLWWFQQYTVAKKKTNPKPKSGPAHRNRADTCKLHKIFLLLHSALLAYQFEHCVQFQARITQQRTLMRYCISLRNQKSSKHQGQRFVSMCLSRMREHHLIQEGLLQSGAKNLFTKIEG